MKLNQNVLFFIAITTVFTIGAHFLATTLPGGIRSLLIMWSPGLSALLVGLINKRPLKEIGWKLNWKWMGLGWLIPIIYSVIAYGLIWILGLGEVPNPTFLERAQLTTGFQSESQLAVILVAFLFITLVNLLPSMVMALGEEIGWRGFLVPELAKLNSFKTTSLISGLLWSTWHLPGILSGDYGDASTPIAFRLICFFLMVLGGAIILTWIRLESGSIWAVAIFHATHNGVIQAFFDRLTLPKEVTPYFSGEFGIAVPLVSVFLAIWILKKKHQVAK